MKTHSLPLSRKKHERSIFSSIFTTLLAVLLIEAILLQVTLASSNVTQKLSQNALDILDKQVENRSSYINDQLSEIRELTDISTSINEATQELLDSSELDIDTIDQSSDNCLPLFNRIMPDLISALRSRPATGIFITINTHSLDEREADSPVPCVYLRDLDPDAAPSARNSDLLLERAPSGLVKSCSISTDKGWTPTILYKGRGKDGFFQLPFQTAYEDEIKLNAQDYGRLVSHAYTLTGDNRSAIAYSQPLILNDGTVYGVIGIEMLTSYLESRLPSTELQNDNAGFYILASTTDDLKSSELELSTTVISGSDNISADTDALSSITLHRKGNSYWFDLDGERQYVALREMSLYSRNAPFSNEHWVLMGVVGSDALFSFSDNIRHLLFGSTLITLLVGLLSSFLVGRVLAKPVAQLSEELASAQAQGNDRIPQFSRTGIRELDQFAAAITQLTRKNLAAAALERMRIEHERDYDVLTGLYNRQSFQRVCNELFTNPDQLKHAALLMMDLDNLKHINDTYGHDLGDQYLHQTGQCLLTSTPPGTLCCRLSGDEFLLLFYGYDSQADIRLKLDRLRASLAHSVSTLPNGSDLHISVSGGVAWYPEDSTHYETLKKYADFAMYQVKHSEKGRLFEFDLAQYNLKAQALQARSEFEQMVRNEQVTYFFQPIYETRHGRVVAYEALMRVPDLPTLASSATVMKLANEMGRLYDIERLTFFKASERFEWLRTNGLIRKDALLFINSIASISLNDDDWSQYIGKFARLARQLVVEITEEEQLDLKELERKRSVPGSSGVFALDDYGSGYSNGSSLLNLMPRYVKVDISIIRNINTDLDKQRFLKSLIEYARPYGIKVLAEGIETLDELRTVLALGVDLLQGYCLARPAALPGDIAPDALEVIRKYTADTKDF